MSRLRLFLLFATVGLVGCGGSDGPELYNLNGEVTFDGKPVVYGRIEFEPDTTKGNTGGAGFADIMDGKYDTSTPGGRGVIGGPHIIRITGLDQKPPEAGAEGFIDEVAASEAPPPPQPLFSGYTEEKDIPQEDGAVMNFAVPASAAEKKSAPPRRPLNDA